MQMRCKSMIKQFFIVPYGQKMTAARILGWKGYGTLCDFSIRSSEPWQIHLKLWSIFWHWTHASSLHPSIPATSPPSLWAKRVKGLKLHVEMPWAAGKPPILMMIDGNFFPSLTQVAGHFQATSYGGSPFQVLINTLTLGLPLHTTHSSNRKS